MAPKVLTLYKKDGSLHSRKPRKPDFSIDIVLENEHIKTSSVKTFLRQVLYSTEQLNDIRYKLEVLSQQWYGTGHLTNTKTQFKEGTMLYVWTYLSVPDESRQLGVFHKLIPFDIMYLRKSITNKELNDIRKIVETPHLCARKMFQAHSFPVSGLHSLSISKV